MIPPQVDGPGWKVRVFTIWTRQMVSLMGGLFLLVLLVSLHGALQMAHGDPGALFVRPDGSGTPCTQAQPCDLQSAVHMPKVPGARHQGLLQRS